MEIETMRCPLCAGEIKGNTELKYLCKNCFVIFEKRHFEGDVFNTEYKPEDARYRLFRGYA